MKSRARPLPRLSLPLLGLLLLGPAGCGDDPFAVRWAADPQESVLFSLDREELNRPSAFNMRDRRRVVIESLTAGGRWDFALDRKDGVLHLVPPRALGLFDSRAGIVPLPGIRFDEIQEAPRDTLVYVTSSPVPIEMGVLYVIRTHEQTGRFGQRCVYYGKVEAVEIDNESGILNFRHDTSPDCNNRNLVPPLQ